LGYRHPDRKNYLYEDNYDFYNSETWLEIRTEVLERDGYRCRIPECDITENLQVHHIIPRMYKHLVEFDIDHLDNLITLCNWHHKLAERLVSLSGKIQEHRFL